MSASATSARSISMSWGPPIREQQNGIVRYYLVTLRSAVGTVTHNISSIQQSISILGLRPYTVYNCTIQAETVRLGPSNDVIQVSTPQDGELNAHSCLTANYAFFPPPPQFQVVPLIML